MGDTATVTEPSISRWQVGDVVVSMVYETDLRHETVEQALGVTPVDLDPFRSWCDPYLGPADEMVMSVHSFCVEADGRRYVVDTCIGNDKHYGDSPMVAMFHGLETPYLDNLARVGFAAADVDVVICTHLHNDHVGWNTVLVDGVWQPTFANARYVMSQSDISWFAEIRGSWNPFPMSVQPLLEAGLVDAIDTDVLDGFALSPSVSLVATPGHTPGHFSVLLHSNGARALITGDAVHSPLQLVRPQWTYRGDVDPQQAARAAAMLADDSVDRGTMILGTHFPAPTAGWVRLDESVVHADGTATGQRWFAPTPPARLPG
jgi:glyoxylase-like metal-dependent hydrolase (beta-lactamase superfamily II)